MNKTYPAVHFHIHFGRHNNAGDAQSAKKYFDNIDLYMPEMMDWTDDSMNSLNYISYNGLPDLDKIAKEKNLEGTFQTEIQRYLNGKKIRVISPDVKHGSKLANLFTKDLAHLRNLNNLLVNYSSFDELASRRTEDLKKYAQADLERELHISREAGRIVKWLCDTDEHFSKVQEIECLITIGYVHARVYDEMSKLYKNVTCSGKQDLKDTSYVNKFQEAIKQETEPSKDLVPRALLDELLQLMKLNNVPGDPTLKDRITAKASIDEIKAIFESYHRADESNLKLILKNIITR